MRAMSKLPAPRRRRASSPPPSRRPPRSRTSTRPSRSPPTDASRSPPTRARSTVTTWDRPEAEITARRRADSSSDDSADVAARKVDETRIEIDGGGSSVRVKSDYNRVRDGSLFAHLRLAGNSAVRPLHGADARDRAARRSTTTSPTREVTGLQADLKLHTYKGRVRVDGLDGGADVDTYKGDVRVRYARYAHASRFETYKGDDRGPASPRQPLRSRRRRRAARRRSIPISPSRAVERAGWRAGSERARGGQRRRPERCASRRRGDIGCEAIRTGTEARREIAGGRDAVSLRPSNDPPRRDPRGRGAHRGKGPPHAASSPRRRLGESRRRAALS